MCLLVLLLDITQAWIARGLRRPVFRPILLRHLLVAILVVDRDLLHDHDGHVVVVLCPHGQDPLHGAVIVNAHSRDAGVKGCPAPSPFAGPGRARLAGPSCVSRKFVAGGLVAGFQSVEAALEEWAEERDRGGDLDECSLDAGCWGR